jgi:hypothetical protein
MSERLLVEESGNETGLMIQRAKPYKNDPSCFKRAAFSKGEASRGPFFPGSLRGIQFQRQFFFQLLGREEVDPVHPQKDGNVNMCFHVVDKENLLGFDRSPLDGLLKDLDGRFLKSHLIGQNPLIKGLHNREF